MAKQIIISGAGGQGIMLLGKILAEAAMREGKHVTWFPAYGAEVRGGTAYCMVIICEQEIGSPVIDKADALIAMNEPSWQRFKKILNPTGTLVLNTSLAQGKIERKNLLAFPFTDIAARLGNAKVANIVALGCLLAKIKLVTPQSVAAVIEEMGIATGKKEYVEINRKALKEGMLL